MTYDQNELEEACMLWAIVKAELGGKTGMTLEEIRASIDAMPQEEKLDALARYQESGVE